MWRCRSSGMYFLASAMRALGLATALLAISPGAHAQVIDPFLLAPRVDGDLNNPPRFGTWRKNDERDASRFRILRGQAGTGAGSTGFDSRNLKKRKSKQAQPKETAAGSSTGKPAEVTAQNDAAAKAQDTTTPATPDPGSPKLLQPGTATLAKPARNPFRPGAPPATPDAETATIATIAPR